MTFNGVGNGGWAGFIGYGGLISSIQAGYAAASTDTGHKGASSEFLVGHPEKWTDYAHRAVHEMTVAAKFILAAHYGKTPAFSYWNSCSTGGAQGLIEAWRYPNDYDGIIAGAPSNPLTVEMVYGWMAAAQALQRTPGSALSADARQLLHDAALKYCDAKDGLADGLIQDPALCRFDPAVVQCKNGGTAKCLTAEQVAAARRLYAPVRDPRTKKVINAGLAPGSELTWGILAVPNQNGLSTLKNLVFKNPAWDFKRLNLSSYAEAAAAVGESNNPLRANLRAFLKKGGRLLLYHGWNDVVVVPGNSIAFYEGVLRAEGNGTKTTDAIRLFLAPGMSHCGGGEGPNQFDKVAAMEMWVEKGKAPETIVASHSKDGKVVRTRPLCAYPRIAVYNGSGSTDEAASFTCQLPSRK